MTPPWSGEIDPTKPADNDPASQGDDQIRGLKAALAERLASRMPGWPATQPLRILAADVGTLASRPAAPSGDGQIYIQHEGGTKKFFYGAGGAWHELATGGGAPGTPSALAAPTGLSVANNSSCVGDVPTYSQLVTWVDAANLALTRVYVNGVQSGAAVAFDVEEKTLALPPGTYLIGVRHELGSVLSDLVQVSVTITNPCVVAPPPPPGTATPLSSFQVVDASFCSAGPTSEYFVDLSWVRSGGIMTQVRIKMNGTQIYLVSSGSLGPISHSLPGGAGTYTFEATEIHSGIGESAPITRVVNVVDPCISPPLAPPSEPNVEEDGVCVGASSNNEALISWTNNAAQKTRVYREQVGGSAGMLVELAIGTVSFLDTTVVTGQAYHYWLTHYDPGGPTESAETGSAYYEATNLCPPE